MEITFLITKAKMRRFLEMSVCSPELLVGFNQETQVSVLTQVRSNEHFRRLAALLPKQT